MHGQIKDLLKDFQIALDNHDSVVNEFIEQPSAIASEKIANSYKNTQRLRSELRKKLSKP